MRNHKSGATLLPLPPMTKEEKIIFVRDTSILLAIMFSILTLAGLLVYATTSTKTYTCDGITYPEEVVKVYHDHIVAETERGGHICYNFIKN